MSALVAACAQKSAKNAKNREHKKRPSPPPALEEKMTNQTFAAPPKKRNDGRVTPPRKKTEEHDVVWGSPPTVDGKLLQRARERARINAREEWLRSKQGALVKQLEALEDTLKKQTAEIQYLSDGIDNLRRSVRPAPGSTQIPHTAGGSGAGGDAVLIATLQVLALEAQNFALQLAADSDLLRPLNTMIPMKIRYLQSTLKTIQYMLVGDGLSAPCVRSGCPCDSFNGENGNYCCLTCRDGTPCDGRYHVYKTEEGNRYRGAKKKNRKKSAKPAKRVKPEKSVKPKLTKESGKQKQLPPSMPRGVRSGRRLVLREIFSGTGVLGRIAAEKFGWHVCQIDNN